jgi:hypothetical protein
MAAFIDKDGKVQQVTLEVGMYKAAADNGLSLEQHLNREYPTAPNQASAYTQFLASEGIFINGDRDHGIRSASLGEILNGRSTVQAGTIVKEAIPASRILFPAALMTAIEDKLKIDLETVPNAFEQMIAVDDSINHDRFERPVLNFSRPEAARSQTISQLALPASMLTITASDTSRKIPTMGLGLEISEQAMKATSMDLVGLALARQAATERNERANDYILSILNGDLDQEMAALAAIPGKVKKALDFDSTIAAAGVLTQKAWIKWLFANSTKRRVTHVITDIDTAMAIENRVGKPTNQNDNPNSQRIDAIPTIINPAWDFNTKIFITQDPRWPAGTIVGLDSRYGLHRVKSLTAQYEAIEALVMRRATQMRFDHGEIVYRLFDEAFEVLTLTL